MSSDEDKLLMFSEESKESKLESKEKRVETIAGAVKTILENLGEDPSREGLLKTPTRMAKALMFFVEGYETNIDGYF